MPRSRSPFLFEQLTGEIVFSYLTSSLGQSVVLPRTEHQSRRVLSTNSETKAIFNVTKQLLTLDCHPYKALDQLEMDLFFRFDFEDSLCLKIPPLLKSDFFIIGDCQASIYTEDEKVLYEILSSNLNISGFIFPDQSPAVIDDYEQATTIHHRYCIFESTLNIEKVSEKLLQMERILAFLTARHLFRFGKGHRSSPMEILPSDLRTLIKYVQADNIDGINCENISALTSLTLSCVGFAGFSMPQNLQCDIVKILNSTTDSQDDLGPYRFYFLNALLTNGRLLFYHASDTQKAWRHSIILTSVALLSERLSRVDMLQKSIHSDLYAVLDKITEQTEVINAIRQSFDEQMKKEETNTKEFDRRMQENNRKMADVQVQLDAKIEKAQEQINLKIDQSQERINQELTKIIGLMNFSKQNSNYSCSCSLL